MKRVRWIVGGLGAVACLLPHVELEDSNGSGASGGKGGSGGSATSGGTAGDGAGETSGGSAGSGGTTGNGGSGGSANEGGSDDGGAGTATGGESGEAGMGGTRAGSGGRAMGGAGGANAGAGGTMAGTGGTVAGTGGTTGGTGGTMAGAGGTMGGAGGTTGGSGGAGSGGGGMGGTSAGSGGAAGACTFPTAESAWPDSPTVFCTDGSIAGACPSSSQTAFGQDGNHVRTVNTYSLANGVVSDALLGLEWIRTFPGPETFGGASDHCETLMFDGKSDWRLPNRLELVSLVDYGKFDPVLDTTFFNAPTGTYRGFWSRTAHASMGQDHWIVTSDDGNVIARANLLATQVRCVRGSPFVAVKSELAGCSIIFDSFTGLGFQKFPSGQTFGWTGALAHCENLEQDGFFDWRLPSVKELLTIVDASMFNPAVDATFFPGTPAEMFWTSTPFVNSAANAWVVDFTDGSALHDQPTSAPHRVRCVRGG